MINSRRLTVDAETIEVLCTSEDLSLNSQPISTNDEPTDGDDVLVLGAYDADEDGMLREIMYMNNDETVVGIIDTDVDGSDYALANLDAQLPLEEGEVYDVSDQYALMGGNEDPYVAHLIQPELELGESELLAVDPQFDAEQMEAELLWNEEIQMAATQDDVFLSDADADFDTDADFGFDA